MAREVEARVDSSPLTMSFAVATLTPGVELLIRSATSSMSSPSSTSTITEEITRSGSTSPYLFNPLSTEEAVRTLAVSKSA